MLQAGIEEVENKGARFENLIASFIKNLVINRYWYRRI